MPKKNILISMDLNDENSKKIAEILGSKTCKKIINFLLEREEASEKDISDNLKIPINTIEYNLKKLENSGIIKKSKNFFWSKKGRKISTYKLSNKTIIIQPSKKINSKIKSIAPVAILSGLLALIVRQLNFAKEKIASSSENLLASVDTSQTTEKASQIIVNEGNFFFSQPSSAWLWFLSGMLIAIAIFSIINWRKI